jgi:hypothetical protein
MTYSVSAALGIHCEGDGSKSTYDGFGTWLGKPAHYRITFPDRSSWSNVVNWYYQSTTAAWLAADAGNVEVLSIPLILSGESFSTITGGSRDSYFTTLANNIVATGHPDRVIVRLGWEHNGNWWPWTSVSDPAGYAAAFAHVAAIVKGVDSSIRFSWCTDYQYFQTAYPTGKTWKDAYPGDAYVDVISSDAYQEWLGPSTPSTYWSAMVSPGPNGIGLQDIRDFAVLHSKPEACEEWGCSTDSAAGGFGDDPTFIDNMSSWFATGNTLYQSYWNTGLGGPDAAIQGTYAGNVPNAAAEYISLFGGSTMTTTVVLTDASQHYVDLAPGTYTFRCYAAAGGSGAAKVVDPCGAGAGGSGGFSEQTSVVISSTTRAYYNLGYGGYGGPLGSRTDGAAGTSPCWIGPNYDGSSPWCLANPGGGGQASAVGRNSTTGGAGGSTTGAVGTTKKAGNAGAGCTNTTFPGGGGGCPGKGFQGAAGSVGTSTAGGNGGKAGSVNGGTGGTSTSPQAQNGLNNDDGGSGGGGSYDGSGSVGGFPGGGAGAGNGLTMDAAGQKGGDGQIKYLF